MDLILRIALLGYRSNPFSGGQGVYLRYISRALADLGHQVDVISGQPYPDLHSSVTLIKLPGLNLYAEDKPLHALRARHLTSFTDLFEWFSVATGGFPEPYTFGRRVLQHLLTSSVRYDVIHDNQTLSWGILKLQQLGQPLVTTIHHPISRDLAIALDHCHEPGLRLLIKRWHHFLKMQTQVARQLRHIVTVSECAKTDISTAFNVPSERIQVVLNGVDTQQFCPSEQAFDPNQLISTASADQPLKGLQHLLPAFAQLREHRPALKLTVIGQLKTGGQTERLIQQLNLAEHIEFAHGISNQELNDRYARAAIAVVPSEYEGFGLPAAEAMACGVPVVSTDGGGLPEVVGDAAVTVPAGDAAALATAIGTLLDDPAQQRSLRQLGRARMQTQFSWHKAATELVQCYSQAVAP